MNVQEYILSGIIESYVLGLASQEERSEFEKMCRQYPEVLGARIAFESLLEEQAMQNAIKPSTELKQKIFDEINFQDDVVKISEAPVRSLNWLKIAVAACFFLLAGSIWWSLTLRNENKNLKNELNSSNDIIAEMKRAIQQPGIRMARMDGTSVSPQSYATVYWDTTSHDVYLLINNMPKPASGKQYQLWAFINKQPVDMGLIELSEKPLQLYRMKNAQVAQAFAITLEDKGNGPVPHGAVYVMGNP